MVDYDCVVVGAGVSGLLSALTLSKQGLDVLVVEKEPQVGGNLRSYEVDGFQVDTGLHAITHVNDGPLTELMNKYFDVLPKFQPYKDYRIRTSEKLVVFPWTLQDWVNFDVIPQKDRILITSILGSSVAFSVFGGLDRNQSVYDYLKANDFTDKTWKFIDTFCYFMSGKNMRKTPVWRLMKGARYLEERESQFFGDKVIGGIANIGKLLAYDGSYHQAYPTKGVQVITDCIVDSFPRGKVTVKTSEKVLNLGVDEKVKVVETDKRSYRCSFIVYSGYMKELPKICDTISESFKTQLMSLEQSKSITIWLGLSQKLEELNYLGSEVWFESGKSYWAMPTSNYNRFFAPSGCQLVGFTGIVEEQVKKEQKSLYESIYTAIPVLEDKVVMDHVQVSVPEKAAITVGSRFPTPKSEVEGLYLVGTDTDTRSMGVTRASFSILELLKQVRVDKLI